MHKLIEKYVDKHLYLDISGPSNILIIDDNIIKINNLIIEFHKITGIPIIDLLEPFFSYIETKYISIDERFKNILKFFNKDFFIDQRTLFEKEEIRILDKWSYKKIYYKGVILFDYNNHSEALIVKIQVMSDIIRDNCKNPFMVVDSDCAVNLGVVLFQAKFNLKVASIIRVE